MGCPPCATLRFCNYSHQQRALASVGPLKFTDCEQIPPSLRCCYCHSKMTKRDIKPLPPALYGVTLEVELMVTQVDPSCCFYRASPHCSHPVVMLTGFEGNGKLEPSASQGLICRIHLLRSVCGFQDSMGPVSPEGEGTRALCHP